MEFKIHAHACLEVITSDVSLICDPWLLGSAYWRSWWNYPPVKSDILQKINPDYIYITHLHWDHFHGPSLRKLGTDKIIIIPKTPELRLLKDIQSIGFKNIIELEHGKSIQLGKDLKITSYQFWPLLTDSALIIEAEDQVIFNSNDAKIMGLPLKQILKRHPEIDFVLRSHSSANSKVCFDIVDQDKSEIELDNIERYSQDFADFVKAVRAKYAIPFASNQCCLHPETIKYNKYNNYAHKVRDYFQAHNIKKPQCVVMAPGDSWSSQLGFLIHNNDLWYSDPELGIKQYQEAKANTINKVVAKEKKTKFKVNLAKRYAESILQETPWFLRKKFKNHPITIIGYSDVEIKGLYLDIYHRKYEIIEQWNLEKNPIQIYVNNAVLNDVWAKRHWNSLGVSKRLRIKIKKKDIEIYGIFNSLNNSLEVGSLQSKYIFTHRYIWGYLKRWRELLLYIEIIFSQLRGQKFQYKKYLPTSKLD